MKKLLHMAALSVVSGKGEMAAYYHRKVAQAVPRRDKNNPGGRALLVLNAVRNKIIHPGGEPRVFACIRDNRKYEKIYATRWPPLPLFKP